MATDGVEVTFAPSFDQTLIQSVLPQLNSLAQDIEKDMHVFHQPNIDTGDTDRSIFTTVDPHSGTITGGATTDYAYWVENGHEAANGTQVGPFPFVRPSFNKKRGEYK